MLDAVATSLERYMDLVAARQKLVASNIANAETPGYKTVDLDFDAEFRNALAGQSAQPRAVEVTGLAVNHDGNNVDLDREARMLAENDLRFNVAEALLKGELQETRMAITGGGSG
jgi:flagellar basal-body rod protein FlgB